MNQDGVIREEQSQQNNLECVEEFDPFPAGQVPMRGSGNNYEMMFGIPVNLKQDGQEE